ncbi:MAG: Gfo/Idh/MocA family oxidoreductase, partial [Opitutales bacterium]|nr:Gfo/Idh/MocA family oxidoreductase [Opitutales bacterium]
MKPFGIPKRFNRYAEMLEDDEIDAIHINMPIPLHASQSIEALRAGKHAACTVPMATNLEALKAIVRAQQESGRKCMMMETVVYSREFLYVQDLYRSGKMGRLQFLRGAHQQEMASGSPFPSLMGPPKRSSLPSYVEPVPEAARPWGTGSCDK